ncbi:hypothetical protein CAPTEDRAFT_196749, partial [Capitella teleta]
MCSLKLILNVLIKEMYKKQADWIYNHKQSREQKRGKKNSYSALLSTTDFHNMSIAERTKSKASQYRQLKESEGGRQFLQENLVKQTAIREPRVPGQETQLRQLTEI